MQVDRRYATSAERITGQAFIPPGEIARDSDTSRVYVRIATGWLPIESDTPLRFKMDDTSDPLYIYFGEAEHGSATSALVWSLERMTVATSNFDAVDSGDYTKAWDNRLTETYT